MKKNMGIIDRVARLVIAALVVILYFTHVLNGTIGIVLLTLSGVLTLTAIIGSCPLYFPLKISTESKKQEK
ncbi:MAG: DUF2892 domain-containing protein [Bacteroidetes bacterium]|nr:DUF2892 domain-containing protein [Bacteroidota bacterium]